MDTIGIIGRGFVGQAVFDGMKHAFDIVSYDKAKGYMCYERKYDYRRIAENDSDDSWCSEDDGIQLVLNESDGPIFVCVPTPMNPDGSCNTSIVQSVISKIDSYNVINPPRVVVIKSTVVPGTTERIGGCCKNIHVCFNPEFLRETTAIEDFKNQDRIIIGGPHEGTAVLKQMYNVAYPDVPVTKTSATIAEMVKYVTNGFLATKVAFANEIEQICHGLDVDYDKVIEYATKDKRLGNSHWSVPGPDGKRGFGGSCFPKDMNGMIALSKSLNLDCQVIKSTWQSNLVVRPERDWEQLVGRAVNPS
jgi:UDPglucose 6-dehydrogenase